MPRTVKKPEVRRQEILTAAATLFSKQGYEKTSVEAIIQRVNIAKGTFYYYFKSKKSILAALVTDLSTQLHDFYHTVAITSELSSTEKLNRMLRGPSKKSITEHPALKAVKMPKNRELQEQLNIACIQQLSPVLTDVLQQGYYQGEFPLLITLERVQIILAGSQFILDSGLFNWEPQQRQLLLQSLQELLEISVGVNPQAFSFITQPSGDPHV